MGCEAALFHSTLPGPVEKVGSQGDLFATKAKFGRISVCGAAVGPPSCWWEAAG